MQKAMFISLFFPTLVAVAAERAVECGDHWSSVEVNWADGQTVGKAFFSGDGPSERSSTKAEITHENKLIRVKFLDEKGGQLTVEDGVGKLKETRDGKVTEISPCHVK